MLCWLCSGERPGCKCMAEDLDELVDGEQGRPVDQGVWTEESRAVHPEDDWLSDRAVLAGRHGPHLAGEMQERPSSIGVFPPADPGNLAGIRRSGFRGGRSPWDQPDADPIGDLRDALAALGLDRPAREDDVVIIGGPAHGTAFPLPPGRTHVRVPEEEASEIWERGTFAADVPRAAPVAYDVVHLDGRRFALAPGWEVIQVYNRGHVTDEAAARGLYENLRAGVRSDQRAEVQRLHRLGSVPLTATRIETHRDEALLCDVVTASSWVALRPPPGRGEGRALSDYEDALAELDTAVQEFVRRTGKDQMVSAWVVITQSVTYEGDRPGATVMNYGSPGGTAWAIVAGLIRYAARSHDLVIQPGQTEADETHDGQMLLAWLAGLGTGVSATIMLNDWRTERAAARHRRSLEQARRSAWAEPLRLFTPPAVRWEEAKAQALLRDYHRCQRCGQHDTLDVHHRRARGMGGTTAKDRLSNLLTLCRACHDLTEAHPVDARALGYRLDIDQEPAQTPVWATTVNGPGWWLLHDDGSMSWMRLSARIRSGPSCPGHPTSIICVRLSAAEVARLDALADKRSDALRLLIGAASTDGLFAGDESLPVLWWRLIGDLERFNRTVVGHGPPPPTLRRAMAAVHQEDYPAALDHFRDLQAEYEPGSMVWPPPKAASGR